MFVKCGKGAETPRFRKVTPAPRPQCSLRHCLVDGKPAVFHRWVEVEKGFLQLNVLVNNEEGDRLLRIYHEKHTIPACCSLEKLKDVGALVEWSDGSVAIVAPKLLKFTEEVQS